MFPVPDSYVADLDPGERTDWLAALPDLALRYADRWTLRPDGPPLHGNVGVIWPVRRADDTPAMLKLSWPHDEAQDEGIALATWAGRGTVRLLEHDDTDYALLLERLDPHHSLNEEPIDTAVEIAGGLLRTLSIPAPPLRRTVTAQAADWLERLPKEAAAHGDPVPPKLLATVLDHCRHLGPTAGRLMVNEDLHYFNVLRGDRAPWLLIDPKPIVGDPEFGVIPLLWNRYDETGGAQGVPARFDAIVRTAGLDRELARAWTLVRAVANWLWALPDDFATVLAGIAGALVD
jgi:streptomycin 6-kinase